MADPTPPKLSPAAWLLASRKGLLTLLVVFIAAVFVVVIAVQVVKGQMAPKDGFTFVTVTILGSFGVVWKAIDGIATEDAAAKSAGGGS